MKLGLPLLAVFLLISDPLVVTAQRYMIDQGTVSFFSRAPIENIKAENSKVNSIFTASNGMVAFSIPNREFQFAKKLMQEHFNDKYMESDRFPRSTFSGVISGFSMSSKGPQQVRAKGKLTIHGIVKEIDVPGTFEVKDQSIIMQSTFSVLVADYGIQIPKLLWENVSEKLEISLNLTYVPKQ